MTNTNDKITWERIVKECPELGRMKDEASKVDGSDWQFCANTVWAENFKPRLVRLVGFEAPANVPEWLATHTAYEIAYSTVYNELPDCRMCGCMKLA